MKRYIWCEMKRCIWCGKRIDSFVGDECDRCWELRHRIEENLPLARRMLREIKKTKSREE